MLSKITFKPIEKKMRSRISFLTSAASYYYTARRSIGSSSPRSSPRSVAPLDDGDVGEALKLKPLRVVMDIDECMVHAHMFGDENDPNKTVRSNKNWAVKRSTDDEEASRNRSSVPSLRIMMEDDTPVHIYIRPGLKDFLTEVSKIAEVYAFTAGLPVYARPVIKELDPAGTIFKTVLYREDCTQVRTVDKMFYSKDLKSFGKDVFDPERTILVDNNILSFVMQPNNGVHIKDFYDSPDDAELSKVLELISYLVFVPDVREPLKKIYDIEKSLKQMGLTWNQKSSSHSHRRF